MLEQRIKDRIVESPVFKVDSVLGGYGSVQIVNGISFQLGKTEIVSILGPNGSGKSTFLKILFGLTDRYSGTIEFDGKDISGTRTDQLVKMGISYVPQVENVFSDLTIEENLAMGGYTLKGGTSEAIERIYDLFPVLEERKYDLANTLSGGQRQMLALGRALMPDPKLMLLDEPSAALSPIHVIQIFEKIKELRETGVSIIIVEQNAKSAMKYSDYTYVFANGQVVYHDTSETILNEKDLGQLFLGMTEDPSKEKKMNN